MPRATSRNQHYDRSPLLHPAPPRIIQHLKRCRVGPLQVVQEKYHRGVGGQGTHHPYNSLKEGPLGRLPFAGGGRRGKVRVPLLELRQQARELGEPCVLEQVVGGPLSLYSGPYGLYQRPVRQSRALGGPSFENVRPSGSGPAEELLGKARLAYPWLAQNRHDASFPFAGAVILGDQRPELLLAAHQRHLQHRKLSTNSRSSGCWLYKARAQRRPLLNLLAQAMGKLLHLRRGLHLKLSL